MLKKFLLFFLPIALVLLASCNKKTTSFDDQLMGNWRLYLEEFDDGTYIPYDTSGLFINLSSDPQQFQFNLDSDVPDTVLGTWAYSKDDSVLTMHRLADDIRLKIDSTVVTFDSIYKEIHHYTNGVEIVSETQDTVIQHIASIKWSLERMENDTLQLTMDGGRWSFVKVHPNVDVKPMTVLSVKSISRGLVGMMFLIGICWLFSANRKAIDWNLIIKGLALQVIIAVLVLKVPFVESMFDFISKGFVEVIKFTDDGVNFLFGQMGLPEQKVQPPLITFAIKVLPTIIFFSALVSLFYYWGILQKVVYAFAWVMKKFMRLSGAESLAAAGNVFLGQTEAPLLVKPYLLGMTKSEIMCLMTGGMATIAGGVLAAYVNFLGGDDPVQQAFFAKHLLTASIISAPAAIIAAKILVPETDKINEDIVVSKEKIGTNALEAISNGTTDGLKLAVNVGAMLLVFTALMALGNGALNWVGDFTGLNEKIATGGNYDGLSFEFILGNIGRPIVWVMGVDWKDSLMVGELLGTKTVLNEFIAYPRLGEMKEAGLLSEKSIIMSTYMLCGFANFASIGIQIGGIGSLIPTRKGLLSKLGVRALIGGTVACLMTAVIVGMML